MLPDNDWDIARPERGFPGIGLLRPTLLFGTAAIAIALAVVPLLETNDEADLADAGPLPQGLDLTTTGSVAPQGGVYVIRRSVLQSSPDSYCVIRANGRRAGDC